MLSHMACLGPGEGLLFIPGLTEFQTLDHLVMSLTLRLDVLAIGHVRLLSESFLSMVSLSKGHVKIFYPRLKQTLPSGDAFESLCL